VNSHISPTKGTIDIYKELYTEGLVRIVQFYPEIPEEAKEYLLSLPDHVLAWILGINDIQRYSVLGIGDED
jgi:hypothetical protein